jgi:hypothetical protein
VTSPAIVLVTLYDGRFEIARTWAACERARQMFLRDPTVAELPPDCFQGGVDAPKDVVRARSMAAGMALKRWPDATHVLWWDDDVLPRDLGVIGRMFQSGHDFVGCPYPIKRIRSDRVDDHGRQPLWRWASLAYDYPYQADSESGGVQARQADGHGCIDVDRLPFGLMLTSTTALRKLVDHYRDAHWFTQPNEDGELQEYVGIFELLYSPITSIQGQRHRMLWSEDYSCCERWRALGGKVKMYVGEGSPVAHLGGHAYQGTREGLRYAR